MANTLLMPKATAVWLVDNTSLSFEQIAQFCTLHPLEVKAIADGEAAQGIKGMDPVMTGQLSRDEIARAEKDPNHRLQAAGPEGAGAGIQAQGAPLHAAVEAPGPAERHPVAGAQPSRTQGRPDLAPGRHHQVDHRADPRPQALEFAEPGADGSGDARPVLADRSRLRGAARLARHASSRRPAGDTLLPAALTERLPAETAKPRDEDRELDADAVFAKLSSLKSKTPDE